MNRAIPAAALMTLALSVSGVALSDYVSDHSIEMSSDEMFKKADGDRDGMLRPGEANTNNKLGDHFVAMDANKDGKVSKTEYQNYMTDKHWSGSSDMGK